MDYDIDIRKIRDYCLNNHHPVGKHKARIFATILGIHKKDATLLRELIFEAMEHAELKASYSDTFGERFTADIHIQHKGNTAMVRTVWIIRKNKAVYELLTSYIKT
jgi:hypothetical protein